MTLHWWMHWFWVTLFHSVVAFPLLLPGTLSAPSQEKQHGIQSPVSSPPPVSGGGASWEPKATLPIGGVGLLDGTETEKVATGSPPMATNVQRRLAYVSTEGSVIGKEQTSSAKEEADGDESTSESNKEVPLFLEEESDRGWGLDDPAPRPPFFLQSAGLGEGYEEEDEDEGIHASAGVPWLSAAVPRVEIGSASERPTIIPSHEFPSSTVEPLPANLSPEHSAADAVHVREGKAIGVSHVDQQPKQEQKQVEVMGGSDVTISTTVRPTKFEVESSPVKSSSNLNATVVAVDEKDGVKKENITLDSSGPLMDSSSSNSDAKVMEVEEAGEASSPPVVAEEKAKKEDEKEVMGTSVGKEPESENINSSVVEESGLNASKPSPEEEIISPVEAPTAVAVREGSTSVQNPQLEVTKELDGEGQPSEKVDKNPVTTVADVPSSVHQGRMTAPRSLDAASIVGISLGSVLLVGAVAGGVGFVLYRRSLYANKPQTLNDKCSNPDSSGYIDDTLRENSEEMYSLDNDSFLNSLEAMTIQNYWTDSVKHTKL